MTTTLEEINRRREALEASYAAGDITDEKGNKNEAFYQEKRAKLDAQEAELSASKKSFPNIHIAGVDMSGKKEKEAAKNVADDAPPSGKSKEPASAGKEKKPKAEKKADNDKQADATPSPPEKKEKAAKPQREIDKAEYRECREKMKRAADLDRNEKVERLKREALAKTTDKKEREKIMAYNSVQDFTQKDKKERTQEIVMQALDYQERQRVLTISKNNPDDGEKKIFYKKNKEVLETAQRNAAQVVEKALEEFAIELHKRFEKGEDITKLRFEAAIFINE